MAYRQLKIIFATTASFLLALCSCGHGAGNSAEIHYDRDNVEDAKLVDITDSLPVMHAYTHIYILDDTLIYFDTRSIDRQFHAIDVKTNRLLGSFGRFGNGPGEIANFGSIFIDSEKRILYGTNLNQWHIAGFQLDSGLADTTYNAFVKAKIVGTEGPTAISTDPFYLNDSTVIASLIIPNDDWTENRNTLGITNLYTGKSTTFCETLSDRKSQNAIAVSVKDSLIVAAARTHDWIRFFDLNGNLKKSIYGPDFKDKCEGDYSYFHTVVLSGDKIFAGYTGRDITTPCEYEDIIIMNLEGEYLKSLRVYGSIWGLAYHKGTNRLYVALDGEPQFSYIQLDD